MAWAPSCAAWVVIDSTASASCARSRYWGATSPQYVPPGLVLKPRKPLTALQPAAAIRTALTAATIQVGGEDPRVAIGKGHRQWETDDTSRLCQRPTLATRRCGRRFDVTMAQRRHEARYRSPVLRSLLSRARHRRGCNDAAAQDERRVRRRR